MKHARYALILLMFTALLFLLQHGQHLAFVIFAFISLASLTSWRDYGKGALSFGGNDFGALADSTLIHDLMDDFRTDLKPILGLALNLGELNSDGGLIRALRPGQTVTITQYFNPVDPYDVNLAGGYVAQDYNVGDPVTITCPNNPWARSVNITPAEFRVLTGGPRAGVAYDELRNKLNMEMFYSIKKKMISDFFALITSANYTNHTVSAAGTFARSTEVDLDKAIFSRNVKDRSNAVCLLTPTAFGEWAKDHIVIQSYTGQGQSARLTGGGVKSQITDFTFWRTNIAMPGDAARGVVFTKTAAVLINRIPDEPGLGAGAQPATGSDQFNSLATVIDPETGLAFLVRTWKNWNTGNLQLDVASIWKFGVMQDAALERITAA